MQCAFTKHGLNKSYQNVEFISQHCLEVKLERTDFSLSLSSLPAFLFEPVSPDHSEWMALELYPDRKINASHIRRLQGLGSHVHVNKAIGFLNTPKLAFPCYRIPPWWLVWSKFSREFSLDSVTRVAKCLIAHWSEIYMWLYVSFFPEEHSL